VLGVLSGVVGTVFTAVTIGAITVYLMLALPRIKAFAGRALGDDERVGVFSEALRRIDRAIIATPVALTVSIGTAVAVVVFFVVYQQIENDVVAPRVFASPVSPTPISVFLAVLMGGTVGGFVGAVIAPRAYCLAIAMR
jgi:predicted PurR-regulated permease PerM